MGDYKQAIAAQQQSLSILKPLSGDKNIDLSMLLLNLSFSHFQSGNYPQSFQYAKERFELLQHNINSLFNTMNENDRLALSAKYYMNARDIYSLLSVYPADEATQTAYDAALYYKGLLLRSSTRIRESIFKSKNQTQIENYNQLVQLKKKLLLMPNNIVSAINAQDTVTYLEIRKLSTQIDSLDWALTQSTADTTYRKSREAPKWTDVRNKLKDGEVAIEFIISYDTIDNCNCKYGALILKKDFKAPVYVPLFKEKQLTDIIDYVQEKHKNDGAKVKEYRICQELYLNTSVGNDMFGGKVYELIWKPIAKELSKNDTTIYYSPVGILYSIAFAALQDTARKSLAELYDFRMLSSTANIVNQNNTVQIHNAQIYGGIEYYKDREKYKNWEYLKDSEIEVDTLDNLFTKKGIPHIFHTKLEATEEIFRKNNEKESSTVLYILTHGYYADEKTANYDELYGKYYIDTLFATDKLTPMRRGGLALSNANPVWNNDINPRPDNNKDGILLAEEIAELNLSKTDLAILSACKTGLGYATETEGVFGLQRGFKMSGVKSIIMSLWDVDNQSGIEFMTAFFNELLSGKEKHEAFRIAQKTLREKKEYIKDPSKWAVFVMLD
jgi:CHAT domain-containing protein